MKATDLLLSQHREVEQLFDQLETAPEADKKALREELAQNLVAHSVIEKEIFYPAVREPMAELISEAYVEHGIVEYALSQLLSTRPADESFPAKVTVLKNLVARHVQEEETEMLKQAESSLGEEHLEQLGEEMEARFAQVRAKGYKSFLKAALAETAPRTMTRAAPKKTAAKAQATSKRAPARRAPARGAAPARGGATQARGGAAQSRQTAKQGGTTGRKSTTRGSRQGRASSR